MMIVWLTLPWPADQDRELFAAAVYRRLPRDHQLKQPLEFLQPGDDEGVFVTSAEDTPIVEAAIVKAVRESGSWGARPKVSPRRVTNIVLPSVAEYTMLSVSKEVPPKEARAAFESILRTKTVEYIPGMDDEEDEGINVGNLQSYYSVEVACEAALLYVLCNGLTIKSLTFRVTRLVAVDESWRKCVRPKLPVAQDDAEAQTEPPELQAQDATTQTTREQRVACTQAPEAPNTKRKRDSSLSSKSSTPPKAPTKTRKKEAPQFTTALTARKQCYRCQAWGHTVANCISTDKCRRCAGPHRSSECPRTAPALCANCQGPHAASSGLCPSKPPPQSTSGTKPKTNSANKPAKLQHPALSPAAGLNEILQLLTLQLIDNLSHSLCSSSLLHRRPRRKKLKPKT